MAVVPSGDVQPVGLGEPCRVTVGDRGRDEHGRAARDGHAGDLDVFACETGDARADRAVEAQELLDRVRQQFRVIPQVGELVGVG